MNPYYSDDAVTIYHGDCREVLPSLRGCAVLTDPPYNIGVGYGGGVDDKRIDYWPWLREVVVMARDAAPVVALTHRVTALKELTDWTWVGVWNKPWSSGSRMGNSPILPHWEPVIMWGVHSLGTRDGFTSDVFTWNPVPAAGTANRRGRSSWAEAAGDKHPTPKPVELFHDLINGLARGDGPVIDPFMGSGTTLRAAKDLGRKAIGVEINERHCEIAARRMGQEVLDLGGAA